MKEIQFINFNTWPLTWDQIQAAVQSECRSLGLTPDQLGMNDSPIERERKIVKAQAEATVRAFGVSGDQE